MITLLEIEIKNHTKNDQIRIFKRQNSTWKRLSKTLTVHISTRKIGRKKIFLLNWRKLSIVEYYLLNSFLLFLFIHQIYHFNYWRNTHNLLFILFLPQMGKFIDCVLVNSYLIRFDELHIYFYFFLSLKFCLTFFVDRSNDCYIVTLFFETVTSMEWK